MVEFRPPQTEESEQQPISLSKHLGFLREYRSGFDKMTEEKQFAIEQAFSRVYEDLSVQRQLQVRKNIEGIALEIQELPQLHPGFAIIRQDIIGERIVDVLESCGIVDSAKSGGVEHARKMLSDGVTNVLEEFVMTEKDIKARARRSRNAEIKTVANRLLTIGAGIRHELDRLKLTPEYLETKQDKKAKEEVNPYIPDKLYVISPWLKGAILEMGLIGFSTLDKLIDEFLQTGKWLNKI